MKNPLITFYFIVTWHRLFGVFFIACSGWSGLCLVVSWIYWVVGALCWVVVLLIVFGSGFHCVFCRACGLREIQGILKMWRYRLGLFVEMCLICYIFGCQRIARVVCRSLIFYLHVHFFPLIRGTFVYFLCTRVVPLCAFYWILTYQKKQIIYKHLSIWRSLNMLPNQ